MDNATNKTEQLGYRIDSEIKRKFDNFCDNKGYRRNKILEKLIIKLLENKNNSNY